MSSGEFLSPGPLPPGSYDIDVYYWSGNIYMRFDVVDGKPVFTPAGEMQ